MDWNTENVVQWLKTIGLSKYAKRFKGNRLLFGFVTEILTSALFSQYSKS